MFLQLLASDYLCKCYSLVFWPRSEHNRLEARFTGQSQNSEHTCGSVFYEFVVHRITVNYGHWSFLTWVAFRNFNYIFIVTGLVLARICAVCCCKSPINRGELLQLNLLACTPLKGNNLRQNNCLAQNRHTEKEMAKGRSALLQ